MKKRYLLVGIYLSKDSSLSTFRTEIEAWNVSDVLGKLSDLLPTYNNLKSLTITELL